MKKDTIILTLYCVVFSIFIIIRNILNIDLGNNTIVAITSLISIGAFLTLKNGYDVVYLVFILPFSSAFSFPLIALLFCFIKSITSFKVLENLTAGELLPIIVIFLLELINTLFGNKNFVEYFCFTSIMFAALISYAQMKQSNWDQSLLVNIFIAYMVGFFIASASIILINIESLSLGNVLDGSFRVGKTEELIDISNYILSYHVNKLAELALIALILTCVLFINRKINLLVTAFGIIYFLMIGFLTQSRTFLLAAAIALGLTSFTKAKVCFYFIIIFLIAFLLLNAYKDNEYLLFLNAAMERFDNQEMSSLSGRTYLFSAYNDFIVSHFSRSIIGYGVTHYKELINIGSCHNGFQEVVLGIGFTGFICLFYWIVLIWSKCVKENKSSRMNVFLNNIPLISLMFFLQATQFLSFYQTSFFLVFCFLAIRLEPDIPQPKPNQTDLTNDNPLSQELPLENRV